MYKFILEQDGKMVAKGGVSADCAVRLLIAIMNEKAKEVGDVQYVPKKPEEREKKVTKQKPLKGGKDYTPKPCCGSFGPRHLKGCPNSPEKRDLKSQKVDADTDTALGIEKANKIIIKINDGLTDASIATSEGVSEKVVAFYRKKVQSTL